MSIDPQTPEERRRTMRGLRVGAASILALGAQGLVLVNAIENDDVWRWLIWAAVLALLISLFVLESRREQRRRLRNDKHS